LLVPIISAQLSFFDNRFPPAPATRRTLLRNNGQFSSRRNAALQQAPTDEPQNQQISQTHEDAVQEVQEVHEPQHVDSQPPIVQQSVPTQRPRNGFGQQPAPSRRPTTGFPSRVPQQQQQTEFDDTISQTHVAVDEGSDENLTQKQDSALTDISMEDVSTERVTPGVTFASTEDTTGDDFTPTAPVQRPITTTTTTGISAGQRKGGSRGQTGSRGVQKPVLGNGKKVVTQQKPVPTGRRPSAPRDRQQVTQVVDTSDRQTPVDDTTDAQLDEGDVRGGVRDGQTTVADHDRTQTSGDSGDGGHGGHDDGHHDHHSGDPIQWLRDAVRGEPGADYPIFYTPPETGFKCSDQQYPGYYADVEARCQVFHICQENGKSDAFLCPNGTIFSQQAFVCIWWHDFDCNTASQYYNLNAQLYTAPETSQPSQPVDQDFERPSQPAAGMRPSGGRPAAPVGGRPVDSIGGQPGGPSDERIQMPIDESTEVQEQDIREGGVDTESPQVQTVTDGSQEVTADETPAFEGITATQPPVRAPNGRPTGGLKGISNGRGSSRPAKSGTSVTKKTGQTAVPQTRIPITTTRPISGSKKTRPSVTNGQTSIPSSPADKARNGITKSVRPQTSFGGQIGSRPRAGVGTKSAFRTSQRQELDGQHSAPNWYYYFNL
ncbi:unnamed protein product, partial [Medioppia subpectinata]